jgi:hypothetical protein
MVLKTESRAVHEFLNSGSEPEFGTPLAAAPAFHPEVRMRTIFFLAAVSFSVPAFAQQNTQGANTSADALDPAAKARVRVEGAAGGTGAKVPSEASGGATVGQGRQNRRSPPKPTDPQQGPQRGEKSSEREEARGARGTIR